MAKTIKLRWLVTPETLSTIQTAIVAALVVIIGVVANYVRKWFEVKTAKLEAERFKIEADQKRAATEFGLKRLDRIVTNVVAQAEQEKPSGVKPTATENANRLSAAQDEVRSQVKPEIMAAVANVVQNPDKYVTTKIERAVGDLKMAKAAGVPTDCLDPTTRPWDGVFAGGTGSSVK
jgi:hypothetical protein